MSHTAETAEQGPDRPLSVVHLTSSRNRSGGTRQMFLLAQGLAGSGHRVLVCAPPGARMLDWATEADMPREALPADGFRSQWRSSRALRRLAKSFSADLVHAHHTGGHNVALLATIGGGFPPVVVNRGVLFRPEFAWKFRSRRNAAFVTNSQAVKGVLASCGVEPSRVHVVYNAIRPPDPSALAAREPALRAEFALAGEGPVVGAVGRGRPEKGFQFLVDAAPALLERYPRAVFFLVGGGTAPLARLVAERGLSERFRIPGQRTDAVAIMGLFDLFAIPSIGMESCPNVLLEAMAVGLPAVGADTGGIGELIEEGVTGRVVPAGDAPALARAAIELLAGPEALRAMGQRAAERARLFTVERKVEGTLAVYRRVLAP